MRPAFEPIARPMDVSRLSFLAWLLACAAGLGLLTAYSASPGAAASAPTGRPAGLAPTGGYELYLAAHPRCPCTRATLSELQRVLAATRTPVTTRVLLRTPVAPADRDEVEAFLEGPILPLARRLPGAELLEDPGGELARALGATTSGHVVLLAPDGHPLFHGGVTPARSHEGVSTGNAALHSLLRGESPTVASAPTFGCPL